MGEGMVRRKIALWLMGAVTLLFFLPAVLRPRKGR